MVTFLTYAGRYVARGLTLFFGEDKQFVTIRAAERLIEKALWVAEVLRRKVPDLHQIINITEKKIVDVYMPREEGLVKVEKERFLTVVEVTLTRKPTAEQTKAAGYQAPLKNVEVEYLNKESWKKGEEERAEKREARQANRPQRERGERPEREERGDRTETRGGERRRGGRRD
jgi:hypothetical protein